MRTIAGRLLTVVILPLLFALCGPAAQAAVSARDWHAAGDGLLTLDTATGLQWLDVTVTQGLSWNAVTSESGAGGPLAGFRRPTEAEIAAFWTDAGITDIGIFNPTVANFEPVHSLQRLWGNTGQFPFGPPGVTATLVTTAQSFDPVDNMIEGTAILRLFESDGTAAAQIPTLLGASPDQALPFVAHALVQAIPEPSTILLFIIGIASGGFVRRRRRTTWRVTEPGPVHCSD